MHEPLITIFTPTYNREHLLPKVIESVLNQTYKNIEYIIVDDASTDNTELLIKSYNDSRIKYIKNEANKGNLYSSCLAMDSATGEFMGVVDSDDYLELSCVEKCVKAIGNHGLIYTQCNYFGDKSGLVSMSSYKYSKEDLLRLFITFHFRMYRTELWHKIKPLTNVYHAWDYDLSLRLSEVTSVKFLKEPLYNWRIHSGNLHKNKTKLKEDVTLIKEEAIKRRGLIS